MKLVVRVNGKEVVITEKEDVEKIEDFNDIEIIHVHGDELEKLVNSKKDLVTAFVLLQKEKYFSSSVIFGDFLNDLVLSETSITEGLDILDEYLAGISLIDEPLENDGLFTYQVDEIRLFRKKLEYQIESLEQLEEQDEQLEIALDNLDSVEEFILQMDKERRNFYRN